ncbi:MAG: S16 family serine protease [Syntrophobacter sp.]
MFAMEFDSRILNSLPLPEPARVKVVTELLRVIVLKRVLSYFRNRRGTEPARLSQLWDHLCIVRLEDEDCEIRVVSALIHEEKQWQIQVHERIFDYISFVTPGTPEFRLGAGTLEERQMLAFSEFFLRHQIEHILYPKHQERAVILADINFAMDARTSDPTFYRMLRGALSNEMNGMKGGEYLALLDSAEKDLPLDPAVDGVVGSFASVLGQAPDGFLLKVFPELDIEMKIRLLEDFYRGSRDTAGSLLRRTHSLRAALRLFQLLIRSNAKEALEAFQLFKDRWGLVELFKELDLPGKAFESGTPEELLREFAAGLEAHLDKDLLPTPARQPAPAARQMLSRPSEKSLKERIEEARNDPALPERVIELIEKNRLNITGQSGAKYSELIETLLIIPWGKFQKIKVTTEEFEAGLNYSHYGLDTPKEIICDFFTNLIRRYRNFNEEDARTWHRRGSAFLLVGPPGVGKTSLAISVAKSLGIPYHKISLGGMRDEADMRGFGFTYEGSKPGAIVQGLIKMGAMNGMFILDEADKTEKFAIATLLEILDPEQNHLFHDKYAQTTIDIDLSNCHFFLTANTLETVPPVVANRCEVVVLDRYSIEEKISIARKYLIRRIRENYQISEAEILFDRDEETDLLRHLIRSYTYEAGVRELERIIRTLFLRVQRKELGREPPIRITRQKIKQYLGEPVPPRQIGQEDVVGEMLGLGVDPERGVGSVIPIQATRVAGEAAAEPGVLSIVHATGNIEKVMDESRKVAVTGIFHRAAELRLNMKHLDEPIHLHFMGGSTKKDGPSAGGAIALALASVLSGRKIRKDVAMTGEIDTKGRITAVGALTLKIETAYNAGCKTVIIPRENLYGNDGIERFPEALKQELQVLGFHEWIGDHAPFDYLRHILEVVAVDDIVEAAGVAFIEEGELAALDTIFESHARKTAEKLLGFADCAEAPILVFQVKSPDELDPVFLRAFERKTGARNLLLINPEIRDRLIARFDGMMQGIHLLDLDPKRERLGSKIAGFINALPAASRESSRLVLIAPYFLLVQDGINRDGPPEDLAALEWNFSANNYTVQQVKMKGSKLLLNRVLPLLSLISRRELDECPFLGMREGIRVIDISFIPEKYRLDISRTEEILNRVLTRWSETVMKSWGIHDSQG